MAYGMADARIQSRLDDGSPDAENGDPSAACGGYGHGNCRLHRDGGADCAGHGPGSKPALTPRPVNRSW